MRHTQHLADLMTADADPLTRAAHFAACDFYDDCVDIGINAPPEKFVRARSHFRRQLAARQELTRSADLEPVTGTPISSPGYVLGWSMVLAGLAGLAAVWVFGTK